MTRPQWLKLTNAVLLLIALFQVVTGVIQSQVFYGPVAEFHEINGFVLAGLVVVHLALNWGWVKSNLLPARG